MSRAYAPELRLRVIDLIESGPSVAEVAAMVEPTEQTIYDWWNRHLVDTGRRAGTPSIESGEQQKSCHDCLDGEAGQVLFRA
jgi:transposase